MNLDIIHYVPVASIHLSLQDNQIIMQHIRTAGYITNPIAQADIAQATVSLLDLTENTQAQILRAIRTGSLYKKPYTGELPPDRLLIIFHWNNENRNLSDVMLDNKSILQFQPIHLPHKWLGKDITEW